MKNNRPKDKYINVVKFMESEYSCSGMCNPALFYFTQSIKTGLPTQGCIKPFVKDIGLLFRDLGITMMSAGLFFFLMIVFVCPLCCYEDEDAERIRR